MFFSYKDKLENRRKIPLAQLVPIWKRGGGRGIS